MDLLSPTAVLVSLTLVAPAGDPGWSEDGSTEAAALKQRVEAHDDAEVAQQVGERGLVFVEQSGTGGGPPPPGPVGDTLQDNGSDAGVVLEDLERQAEIERIIRKGRRLFIPGIVLSTLGTIFTIGGIAGVAKQATPVSGGVLGASLAISAIGWPMAIAGIRRRKHPEKFLRPVAAIGAGGIGFRF